MQDIDHMTDLEKVQAMEHLWESLTRGKHMPASPTWHGDELEKRAAKIREGKASYTSLDKLKVRGARK